MPLKIWRIGQYRKASRPARRVGAGMGWWIEVCADKAFGWTGLFYFGDKRKAVPRLGPQSSLKPANGGGGGPMRKALRLAYGHFSAFGCADFGEFI